MMIHQKTKLGEKLMLRLETPNGEMAMPMVTLAHLLKSQDLNAWRDNPKAFRNWIADAMSNYFRNLDVVITVH